MRTRAIVANDIILAIRLAMIAIATTSIYLYYGVRFGHRFARGLATHNRPELIMYSCSRLQLAKL